MLSSLLPSLPPIFCLWYSQAVLSHAAVFCPVLSPLQLALIDDSFLPASQQRWPADTGSKHPNTGRLASELCMAERERPDQGDICSWASWAWE